MNVQTQEGTRVTGVLEEAELGDNPYKWVPTTFTGTVTADGEVRLARAESDVALFGSMVLGFKPGAVGGIVTLTYRGGRHDGLTIVLRPYSSY